MFENAKQIFQHGFHFRGRSTRYQFWNFILFTFLVSIILVIINSVVFGPTVTTQFKVTVNASGEQINKLSELKSYNSGWLGTIFSLIVLIPSMAVAWRRMHDVGRPGYLIFLPLAGAAVAAALFFVTSHSVPIDKSNFPEGVDLSDTVRLPNNALSFVVIWLAAVVSFIVTIVFLARRSQPGPNNYGPNPNEVSS